MSWGHKKPMMNFYTQAGKKGGDGELEAESSAKRPKMEEKFKFRPSQSSQSEEQPKKAVYAPKIMQEKPFSAVVKPKSEEEEIDYIDAYFAALPKPASSYIEKRPTVKPTFVTKTSLAGLPSSVPSRPLKENKAKHVPNYMKKYKKDDEEEKEAKEDVEQVEKPNNTCLVKPQRALAFKTASAQLAMNVTKKKNGPSGVNGSFKPPILRNNDAQQPKEPDGILEDERLKNIDPKMVELIENEIMDHGSPVSWDDIAGLEFVKTTVKEIVVFPLLRPDIFHGLRGPPKGLLLFGPPGTGKTLIGKCIASQSKSTFFAISASSLTSKWVGEGEKMVRALFAVARVHQPSVIFIDEIDSVLSSRSDSEHESSRRIKTEFLVQLDGASTVGEERILIVGATNRPQDLDEAARRRLVKRLYVPLPEQPARVQIMRNLLGSQFHQMEECEYEKIAQLTEGYSGADMANLCKEAAMGPIRSLDYSQMESIKPEDVRAINFDDFEVALSQIRASVSDKDLQMYLDWNKLYGSSAK